MRKSEAGEGEGLGRDETGSIGVRWALASFQSGTPAHKAAMRSLLPIKILAIILLNDEFSPIMNENGCEFPLAYEREAYHFFKNVTYLGFIASFALSRVCTDL